MTLLPFLLQGIGYGFSAAVQPGPFQTYLISQTLLNGWRRTLIAALAPLVSDGLIILTVLFVLTRVPSDVPAGATTGRRHLHPLPGVGRVSLLAPL